MKHAKVIITRRDFRRRYYYCFLLGLDSQPDELEARLFHFENRKVYLDHYFKGKH